MFQRWFKARPPKVRIPFNLQPYSSTLTLSNLVVGVDNIHYDVLLSPRFREFASRWLFQLVQQYSGLEKFYGRDWKPPKPADTNEFKKLVLELLQTALNRAKAENNFEIYLLAHLSLYRYLTSELLAQFSSMILECKDRLKQRGDMFERSAEAHVLKSLIAGTQANRRHVIRQVGQVLYQIFDELHEKQLAPQRRALFGADTDTTCELLRNRMIFTEPGRDDFLYVEHYVLLAVRTGDPDHLSQIEDAFAELLKRHAFASREGEQYLEAARLHEELERSMPNKQQELEEARRTIAALGRKIPRAGRFPWSLFIRQSAAELNAEVRRSKAKVASLEKELAPLQAQIEESRQKLDFLRANYQTQISDLLASPRNARLLFDTKLADEPARVALRRFMLSELREILEQRGALPHVLASFDIRGIYRDYCPPLNLVQLKKALVDNKERAKLEALLKQYRAKNYSMEKIEDAVEHMRKLRPAALDAVLVQFAEDFFRKRRDLRDLALLAGVAEKINLELEEKLLDVSRLNHTLYEFLLPGEEKPREDRIIDHVIVKADVRESTRLTKELFARGLNPATYFSQNFYEPVRKILDRYEAVKVFIEGDALILSIYETEANRGFARPVAKACCLARGIIELTRAYNDRAVAQGLPRLEIGLGVAYQNSAPSFWVDGDSRIMISKAINLADRLSSCSKIARKLLPENQTPFNLFVVQPLAGEAGKEGEEEFLIRYNINGIELNQSGFEKLQEEIALQAVDIEVNVPFASGTARFYYGQLPVGSSTEKVVLREGRVAQVTSEEFSPLGLTERRYFEVCVSPTIYQLVEQRVASRQAAN